MMNGKCAVFASAPSMPAYPWSPYSPSTYSRVMILSLLYSTVMASRFFPINSSVIGFLLLSAWISTVRFVPSS